MADGNSLPNHGRDVVLPVNLQSLAKYLGLSTTTVSLILNDSPAGQHLPDSTRQRVIEAAAKLEYRPNHFARSIRSGRSKSIGVLTPSVSDGYFTLVMNGAEKELVQSNYFSFIAGHYWRPDLLREYPRLMRERAVDGFLLLNTELDCGYAVPTVAISAHRQVRGTINIALDHHAAALAALRHLAELGHRSIAFMRGPACVVDSAFRWEGILAAAQELGLEVRPSLCVALEESSSSPESGYVPATRLLARRAGDREHAFTALFCFNDIAAIGALRAIHDAGLHCPQDISIIGFDDILQSAYQTPSLTTIRQPLEHMGRMGAKLLLERIAHPETHGGSDILIAPELIIRESTAPPPQGS